MISRNSKNFAQENFVKSSGFFTEISKIRALCCYRHVWFRTLLISISNWNCSAEITAEDTNFWIFLWSGILMPQRKISKKIQKNKKNQSVAWLQLLKNKSFFKNRQSFVESNHEAAFRLGNDGVIFWSNILIKTRKLKRKR